VLEPLQKAAKLATAKKEKEKAHQTGLAYIEEIEERK